jgi:hypothetical protein
MGSGWKLIYVTVVSLTLSGCMLIYNRHGDSASMDEYRYMIDKVSFAFLWSYNNHILLLATVFHANAFS